MRTKLRESDDPILSPSIISPESRRGRKRLSLGGQIISNAKTRTGRPSFEKVSVCDLSLDENKTSTENTFYGLPAEVHTLYKDLRGIEKLYDWQDQCLNCEHLQAGKNLIISLPTSGGKTLVAEILLLQQILLHKKDVLLILPFVSIVQEKINGLNPFGLKLNFLVEEYAAAKGRVPPTKRRKKNSVYVATIEKAQSIVNSLIETDRMRTLGLVIVDELHMIGESGRGATMEQCLTKIILSAKDTCQIVGMSATLSNIKDIQKFLNAELFSSDFRPVKLKEYIKLDSHLFELHPEALAEEDQIQLVRVLPSPISPEDPDALVPLVEEVIPKSSCMIFCQSKKNCENVALLLCKLLSRELRKHEVSKKCALLKALREECESGICMTLRQSIPFGVAYHHSGLTTEERKLIQEAYLEGTLSVICCTSTLAAGVNLPAKRVILRSPMIGRDRLNLQQYKQMSGRAGRAGLDTHGESIMILQPNNKAQFMETVSQGFRACYSTLAEDDGRGAKALLLSLIALKIVTTREMCFGITTLLSIQQKASKEETAFSWEKCLNKLFERNLVKEENGLLETTQLGSASFRGPIDGEIVGKVYANLKRPLENGIVLAVYLHLLHCVVPHELIPGVTVDWQRFHQEFRDLCKEEKNVLELEGISEGYLIRNAARRGAIRASNENGERDARSYLAIMLNCLWKRERVWDVAKRFEVDRGWLQSLLQSSAAFASCVSRFCEHIPELWSYQCLLPDFVKKLMYCVQMELVPLMDIQGVKQGRARQLYAAGYKSVADVANADPAKLMEEIENLPRKQATMIVANAKMLRQEELAARLDDIENLFGGNNKESKDEISEQIVQFIANELLPDES